MGTLLLLDMMEFFPTETSQTMRYIRWFSILYFRTRNALFSTLYDIYISLKLYT